MFLILCSVSCIFGICPFAGTWMFCGELSTIPLQARWFLIQSEMGASSAMVLCNYAFAFS